MSNPEATETASDRLVSASVCVVGVLAEALAQHEFAPQKGADHVGCFGCDWVLYGIFPRSEHTAHVASVVAALPNIAIIDTTQRWFVLREGWFKDGGKSVAGPFTTRDDALTAREALEKSEGHHSYWVDSDIAQVARAAGGQA